MLHHTLLIYKKFDKKYNQLYNNIYYYYVFYTLIYNYNAIMATYKIQFFKRTFIICRV